MPSLNKKDFCHITDLELIIGVKDAATKKGIINKLYNLWSDAYTTYLQQSGGVIRQQ